MNPDEAKHIVKTLYEKFAETGGSKDTLTPIEPKAMACCPGEEFTPPPKNEDLEIVQDKYERVHATNLLNAV